jgi:tRNA1(Val) A37 N6-methylase TrmN6
MSHDGRTVDAMLGGRLRLEQPRRGHRFGHDAVLLAAACPARAGDRVADLGAGVGAAGLAVAVRVAAVVVLVEVDPDLAVLADANIRRNGLADRVTATVLDVTARAACFAAAGLAPESMAHVVMNPPFNDPARQRTSAHRRLAHAGSAALLAAWTRTAARLLCTRGTLTLIWRADGLPDVLQALRRAFGAVTIMPIYGKPAEPAIRVLVSAIKASRAPLELRPGLLLNDQSGCATAEAEAVLRDGQMLAICRSRR